MRSAVCITWPSNQARAAQPGHQSCDKSTKGLDMKCKSCGASQGSCSALQSRGKRGRQCCEQCTHEKLVRRMEPMKRSLINYELLRRDVEDRPESVADIAVACDVHASLITKLLHGGDQKGISLELFAALVIWLRAPADRYILRPLRAVETESES